MAKLKAVVDDIEDVAEDQRGLYEKADDGKYVLQLDGAPRGFVEKSRHDEMRSRAEEHDRARKELQEQIERYKDIDPDRARELLKKADELENEQLVKAGDIQTIVDKSVEKATAPLNNQIETLTRERDDAKRTADSAVVDTQILAAASDVGKVRKGASDTIVAKAKRAGWQNVNGTLLQMEGDSVVGRDVDQWMQEQAGPDGDLAFCFEPSTGGGGGGNEGEKTTDTTVVDPSDRAAYRKNLDAIAKGEKKTKPLPRI